MTAPMLPQERRVPELNHRQTLARQGEITDEIDRLSGLTELSEEQERRWAEMVTEYDELDAHRKSLERQADRARIQKMAERGGANVERGTSVAAAGDGYDPYDVDAMREPNAAEDVRFNKRNPWDVGEIREWGRDRTAVSAEYRARALSAIEQMPCANARIRKAATEIIETFDDGDSKISRLCLATSKPAYLRAWSKLARGAGHEITRDEQDAIAHARQAVRAMSLTDTAGGYLVPFQLDPTVILAADGSRNQIRQIARTVVATGDVWNGVSAGQVTWSFASEGTEAGDNAPAFTQPTIAVHKAQGFVPISIEAIEDEANVAMEVARLLAFGRDTLEAQAFITGTGSGQPVGIATALNGTASNITSAPAGSFNADDVYACDNALPFRYSSNGSWLAHRAIYNLVRQFDTTGGGLFWANLNPGAPPDLLGRPKYEAEAMASTVATGNDVLIFGDFEHYVIADRVGMTVEFIPHLVGTNRRPTGQRGWYAYYRVGADSVLDSAFRMVGIG